MYMYKCTVCTAWLTERDDLAVFLAANTGVAINSFEPAATNRMTYLSSDPHLDGWVEIKGIIISLGNFNSQQYLINQLLFNPQSFHLFYLC